MNQPSAIDSRPTGGSAADQGVRPTICNTHPAASHSNRTALFPPSLTTGKREMVQEFMPSNATQNADCEAESARLAR